LSYWPSPWANANSIMRHALIGNRLPRSEGARS